MITRWPNKYKHDENKDSHKYNEGNTHVTKKEQKEKANKDFTPKIYQIYNLYNSIDYITKYVGDTGCQLNEDMQMLSGKLLFIR